MEKRKGRRKKGKYLSTSRRFPNKPSVTFKQTTSDKLTTTTKPVIETGAMELRAIHTRAMPPQDCDYCTKNSLRFYCKRPNHEINEYGHLARQLKRRAGGSTRGGRARRGGSGAWRSGSRGTSSGGSGSGRSEYLIRVIDGGEARTHQPAMIDCCPQKKAAD